MIRTLKAEAQGPLWSAAVALQEYASRNKLIPPQSYAHQTTYDGPILGQWSLTSHARLEVVEEDIETENDVAQPETSNNMPDLEVTSHGPSVTDDKCGGATGTERGQSSEGAKGQDTKALDMVPLDDTEDCTKHRTISKPSASPIHKPTEPVIHDYSLYSPPSGLSSEAMVCYRLTLAPQSRSTTSQHVPIPLTKHSPGFRGPSNNLWNLPHQRTLYLQTCKHTHHLLVSGNPELLRKFLLHPFLTLLVRKIPSRHS